MNLKYLLVTLAYGFTALAVSTLKPRSADTIFMDIIDALFGRVLRRCVLCDAFPFAIPLSLTLPS